MLHIQPRKVAAAGLIVALAGAALVLRAEHSPASASSTAVSIWSPTDQPGNPSEQDPNAVELGVKFRSSAPGWVTGIRFYKSGANTGVHVGNLWSSSGTRLATATFAWESGSGWQQVNFGTPVAITAQTTYVASYHTDAGFYADDQGYFAGAGADNGSVHALRDGADGPNSVYAYGSESSFPSSTWQSSNYWVDVVFNTSAPASTLAKNFTSGATPPVAYGATSTVAPANAPQVIAPAVNPTTVTAAPPVAAPFVAAPSAAVPPATTWLAGLVPAISSPAWVNGISSTTSGLNEGHPHGVPSAYDWYSASNGPYARPGHDGAVTAWGLVYWNSDFGNNPGNLASRVEVSDHHLWLSTTTGWKEVQSGPVDGGAYYESFAGNGSDPINIQPTSGDGVSVAIPPNRLFHFYPSGDRPRVPANFTGHWVVTAAARMTQADPRAHFLLATGLDWWQSTTASYPNNDAGGTSRMVVIPNDGSSAFVGFTDLSAAQLAASHP